MHPDSPWHFSQPVSIWGRAKSTCRQVQAEEAEAQTEAEAQVPALDTQQPAIRTAASQD